VVDILGAETLFDGDDIATLGAQLRHLADGGAERLVVNFAGVRAMSSDVLAILASLARRVGPTKGPIRVCGVDPVLEDMLRIGHLERVLDVETREPAPP
jgi:anti-anti-sigma factor